MTRKFVLSLFAVAALAVLAPAPTSAQTVSASGIVTSVISCVQQEGPQALTHYLARVGGVWYLVGYSGLGQTAGSYVTPDGVQVKSDYAHEAFKMVLSAYLSGRGVSMRFNSFPIDPIANRTFCDQVVTRRVDQLGGFVRWDV